MTANPGKAARAAMTAGRPRLVSVQPLDVLRTQGVQPGDDRCGIHFAKNACPSQGGRNVFVEPVLPRPELLVCGASPVAVAAGEPLRFLGLHPTPWRSTTKPGSKSAASIALWRSGMKGGLLPA